jgi:hypothetical protein
MVRLGLSNSSAYRVVKALDLERLDRLIHSYQLVKGTVVAVGEGSGRLYLNFTQDWRRDFTVSVERKDLGARIPHRPQGIGRQGLAGSQHACLAERPYD